MLNVLQTFNNPDYGEIRTLEIEGKPYVVGADVARSLGYKDATNAIKQHCRGVVKRHLTDSLGRSQEMNVIPEGDIYRLIVNSKLPGAEKFERWVFDEVLPSIREHGGYIQANTQDTDADIMARAVLIAQKTISEQKNRISRLSVENEQQRQLIGELKPKADYVDYILSSIGTMTSGQIAADYGMTANKLNKILKEERIHRHVGDQWILYAEHMGVGYTKSETIPIVRSDGRADTRLFTKWTQKGRLMINEVLNQRGIYANMDCMKSVEA